ncbi:MAG: hypothetical protein J6B43_09260 [Lachnospiraceae bacterium]|nr:hypothetical protein [Lachnospiraceae bacterium]
MRSRNRVTIALALVGVCLLYLVGCGEEAAQQPISASTLVLEADGSFTQCRVESFDREYYQLSELDSMIRQEVQDFVSGKGGQDADGGQPVRVEQVSYLEEDSSRVMVALHFADSQVYEAYAAEVDQQPRELFYGTVRQAQEQGYDLTGNLLDAKKGTVITLEQLEKYMDKPVLVFADALQIRCPSRVLYCSSNVSLNDAGYAEGTDEGLKYILMK